MTSTVRRLRPPVGDTILALVVAALLVAGALVTQHADGGETPLTVGGAALLVGAGLLLAWRRRYPIVVAVLVGACDLAYGIASQPDPPLLLATLVALYTVATCCSRRATLVMTAVIPATMAVAILLTGDSGPDDYYRAVLPAVGALAVGDQVRARKVAAERASRRAADDAVVEERRRIARELHDVVAHHVSMVVVQAEAGAALAEAAGDGMAVERFDAIAGTGRDAMTELRRLLGVLRDEGDAVDTEPRPGVDRLPALVDRVRSAGLPIDLVTTGEPRTVPDGVDVSAYRIVQEAITNVVRHAGAVPTTVRVGWSDAALELDVTDTGADEHAPAGHDGDGGRGLVGIRERVSLLGGTLRAGRRRTGGYEVVARLPLPADEVPR